MKSTNVHTHLFCLNDVPDNFIDLYLPNKVASGLVNGLIRSKAGMVLLSGLKRVLKKNSMLKRFIAISEAGRFADSSHLYALLKEKYDQQDFRFVCLTLNLDHIDGGNSNIFNSQLENVVITRKKVQDPSNLLLFMSLDPRSFNSGAEMRDEVKSRFETKIPGTDIYPFCGLKIYPSSGFFVFDEKLKPTFEWAADNEIPVMSHNYYLGGVFLNNKTSLETIFSNAFDAYANKPYPGPEYKEVPQKFFGRIWGTQRMESNSASSSYFIEPESYRSMLQYFKDRKGKPLKICFAHFGGLNQMRIANGDTTITDKLETEPVSVSGQNWHTQILGLMKDFEGVYTDISYMTSEFDYNKNNYWKLVLAYLKDPVYQNKIMFGTDFYLADRGKLGEQEVYHQFREVAINNPVNDTTMWQQLTDINVAPYLKNRFV